MDAAQDHTADFERAREFAHRRAKDRQSLPLYRLPELAAPVAYAATLRQIDAALPAKVRRGWRWRILFLRASLDEELQRSG